MVIPHPCYRSWIRFTLVENAWFSIWTRPCCIPASKCVALCSAGAFADDQMLPSADYIVPVEIESQTHNVYVIKRPGVDHFLTEMGKIYEVVIFTASLSKVSLTRYSLADLANHQYADPVLDMLDTGRVVRHRLFRESCYNHKGNYVKVSTGPRKCAVADVQDLSQLGREMEDCIIIDNSPASYIFHPNNAVPVSTWFNDPHDTELTDLCPFLADLATVDDIRGVLDGNI